MNNTVLVKLTRTLGRLGGRNWQVASALALVAALAGCGDDDMLPTAIGGYNHLPDPTGWSIGRFSVDGHSGPNLSPESGDHGANCCIPLPRQWRRGMKVKVDWSYDVKVSDPRIPPPPQQAEIEIPEYTPKNAGPIQVHLYPEHRIKVVVSRYGIEHPRYPMSEEDKKPWVTDRKLEQ